MRSAAGCSLRVWVSRCRVECGLAFDMSGGGGNRCVPYCVPIHGVDSDGNCVACDQTALQEPDCNE